MFYLRQMLPAPNTIFENSKNALYSGNKNPELKIIYSGKIYPEVVIEFRK